MSYPKSYTQWSIFKTCGARYKFQYVEKRPRPKQDAPAAERGTNIHECVEDIINGKVNGFPAEFAHLNMYEEFFVGLRESDAIAELPFKLGADWQPVEDKADARSRGFIDVICPPDEDNVIYIYELKTGKEYEDHIDQRNFYGMVALSIYPTAERVKVIGVYLDQGFNRENEYARVMLSSYHHMWNRRFDMMDNPHSYVADPGFHCRWCPYAKDVGGPCKFSGNR